jgi:uncharacterized membrane protein
MSDFLNSKSMITPGVAGGVVMLITNTLSSQFGLPAKWIAITVSVLLALLIFFADQGTQIGAKIVVFLLNSVIIFAVSVGTNTVAGAKPATTIQSTPPTESAPEPTPTPFVHPWFGQ